MAAADPTPPARGAPALLVANLAVANAFGLLSGFGGMRTPSTAANLLLAALLVSLPWLGSLRRSLAPLSPRAGTWERGQQRLFVGVVCLAALPVVAGAAWVLGWALLCPLLTLAAYVPLPQLANDLPLAPFGIGLALLLAVAAPWPRPQSAWLRWAWRLLRLCAFALPWGWLGLVAFAGLWTPGAFVGRDPMHEPIATVPAAWGRVEAVRVNAGAFADCSATPGCNVLPFSWCLASVSSVFSVVPFGCCWRSRTTTENTESTEQRSAEQSERRYGSSRNDKCGACRTAWPAVVPTPSS